MAEEEEDEGPGGVGFGDWRRRSPNSSFSSSEELMLSSLPESMVFDSVDEVNAAIVDCKKAILETEERTDSRQEMVLHLIRLQILLEDMKERSESANRTPELGNLNGHRFLAYPDAKDPIPFVSDAKRVLCDVCCHTIWFHLQSSHHCMDCGYSLHTVCRGGVMRGCVAQKVRTNPDFILEICPEKSLMDLKFRCAECDRRISHDDSSMEPRLCDYTGLSFCPSCHWMAQMTTPARIVRNWEFEPHPVSQATKQYLTLMARKPAINLLRENSKLLAVVPELAAVDEMRRRIMQFKKYLTVCRLASEQKVLLHLVARQHFVDGSDHYSLQDLVDVKSGALAKFLDKILQVFADHVQDCVLCLAKGFICEICAKAGVGGSSPSPEAEQAEPAEPAGAAGGDPDEGGGGGSPEVPKLPKSVRREDVLFPFDKCATSCTKCETVFHRHCLLLLDGCPKCSRLKTRKSTTNADANASANEAS